MFCTPTNRLLPQRDVRSHTLQCSMMGAWGKATASGGGNLIQLRTLDFGGGPFANRNVLVVRTSHVTYLPTYPGILVYHW